MGTDPDADSIDLHAAALAVVASELVLSATPEPRPVPDHFATTIVEHIQRWFAEHPALLGAPPLIFSEIRHFLEMHRGELTPRATDREQAVLDAFSAIATDLHGMCTNLARHTRPLDDEPIDQRVHAFLGFRDQWEDHVALVTKCREAVASVDAERLSSPALHRCRFWNGAHVGPLMSVDAFVAQIGPWNAQRALLDGLPARQAVA